MADPGAGNSTGTVTREYRKGNWTLGETMVLIEAKQMDDERRMKRSSGGESSSEARSKPAELRWKWVEDYCWRKGCLRSQNQCNDKWDNLMRDYKKVRDHERKLTSPDHQNEVSYWKMDKNERKEKNLPSNMLLQIYKALVEVVEKKGAGQRVIAGSSFSSGAGVGLVGGGSNPTMELVMERPVTMVQPGPMLHHQLPAPIQLLQPLPLPPPSLQQPPPPPPQPQSRADSSDSDTSEHSDSPAKRRRRGGNGGGGGDHMHGTSTGCAATATASASDSQELGTAISRSASIIAEALNACEEREERRHRDLVSLHEKRLKIEETNSEINRQGINGLVEAINKLANSILALASSNKNQQQSSS